MRRIDFLGPMLYALCPMPMARHGSGVTSQVERAQDKEVAHPIVDFLNP
jgi:hypothetical protein